MSTAAQITANRINSLSSTGPRTSEGKTISSRNATSHGLSSAGDPVLPHEDRAAFDALFDHYECDFAPETAHEEFLVREMVSARWRIARANRLEAIILCGRLDEQNEPDRPEDPDVSIARIMAAKGDPLARLERHRANLERNYQRCAREFRAARKFQNEATAQQLATAQFGKLFRSYFDACVDAPKTGDAKMNVAMIPKVGRNEACPCGSGVKYKKCCLPKYTAFRTHNRSQPAL